MLIQFFLWAISSSSNIPMPPADPVGYPLPEWLLQVLFNATLTLHLLAMQFTLGSCLLFLWCFFKRDSASQACARYIGTALPLGMSYLVTLGIPPLLFTQVIYGQQFYVSSVLMAAFWIQVIFAIIIAYLFFYIHKLSRDNRPSLQPWLILGSTLLMFYVAFIYSNNITLSMMPEKWLTIYNNTPNGLALNSGEPVIHARLLLFLSPAFCIAGLGLFFFGLCSQKKSQTDNADRAIALGSRSFLIGAVLCLLGMYLVSRRIPENVYSVLASSDAPLILLVATVILLIVATGFVVLMSFRKKAVFAYLASTVMLLSFGCEIFLRDLVRRAYLKPYFSPETVPVNPQWGMFVGFLISAVVGVGFLVVTGLFLLKTPESEKA